MNLCILSHIHQLQLSAFKFLNGHGQPLPIAWFRIPSTSSLAESTSCEACIWVSATRTWDSMEACDATCWENWIASLRKSFRTCSIYWNASTWTSLLVLIMASFACAKPRGSIPSLMSILHKSLMCLRLRCIWHSPRRILVRHFICWSTNSLKEIG